MEQQPAAPDADGDDDVDDLRDQLLEALTELEERVEQLGSIRERSDWGVVDISVPQPDRTAPVYPAVQPLHADV